MVKKTDVSKILKTAWAHIAAWWECCFPSHVHGGAFRLPLTEIDHHRRKDLIRSIIISVCVVGLIVWGTNLKPKEKPTPPRVPTKTAIIPTPMPPQKKKPPPPTPPNLVTPPLPYLPPPRVQVPPRPDAIKEKVTHIKPVKQEQPKPKKIIKKKVVHKKTVSKTPPTNAQTSDDADDSDATDTDKNHSAGAVPINGARPEYPPNAEDDNREGKVVASCDILPSGHTANCKVVSAKGGHDFVESALDFLSRARYSPSLENGNPVIEHNHVLTIDFTLGD